MRVLECNCLAALHPFGCTRHSRCAALALSFSPTLARSLSLTLSFSLALFSFPFFPSKLWQVGVDSDADADFAAICYLLVQPLVNEAATQQHPIAPQKRPKSCPATHCPFGCCYLLVGNCIACNALLLLGKRGKPARCIAHVLVYIMCMPPKLRVLHSCLLLCAFVCLYVCEDVEKQKVYNYN